MENLDKYFDPKGPFASLRIAQMKRAWRKTNRRELNFWENTYLPTLISGIYLTSKHFFYNITFHILHLFGLYKEIPGAVTYQYPEKQRPLSSRLRTRHRLTKREDNLDRKLDTLTTKEKYLDELDAGVKKREAALEAMELFSKLEAAEVKDLAAQLQIQQAVFQQMKAAATNATK